MRPILKPFWLVVVMEVLAIFFVSILAYRLHRHDLATDWCAIVVGLHFLPLARIFRAPHLGVIGMLITLWCLLCWALFRPNALVISAANGNGNPALGRLRLSVVSRPENCHPRFKTTALSPAM